MEKVSKVILVFMLVGLVYLVAKGVNYKEEIIEYPGTTICKYTLCKPTKGSGIAYVKYYITGKLYRNRAGGCPDNSESKINKYYVLNYSTIDPDKISVDFSKEIKDSTLIKELASKLEFNYWLDH